jgi:uncharacterized membrane protein YhdT
VIPKRYVHRLLPRLRLTVELSLVAFFVGYAMMHASETQEVLQRFSSTTLAFTALLYTVGHFLAAASTKRLLGAAGFPLRYRDVLSIHLRRLPAKYVPGGIWHTVGRGADIVALGMTRGAVAEVLLVEQALAFWWSGFLGLLLGCFAFSEFRTAVFVILAAWGLLRVLGLNFLRRRARDLARASESIYIDLIYLSGWMVLASAFSVYASNAGPPCTDSSLRIAASYLVSWMIGAAAFFSPQGLGVFEFSAAKLMCPPDASGSGLVWYIGSYRLLVLFADLAAWGTWRLSHFLSDAYTMSGKE